jgi:uncharacterized protein (TIGR00297 family)
MPLQFLVGLGLAGLIALAACRVRSLDRSGAWAAALLGALIFGLGGWQAAFVLLAFFISSSLLSRLFKRQKEDAEAEFAKGGQRDAWQVLANGGLAAAFLIPHALAPEQTWPWLGFAGALAAANADTWATELGTLNPGPPHLITNLGKRIERGASGGVSWLGTLAALGGAALIALAAGLVSTGGGILFFAAVTASGLIGSLVDSLLGATVQAMYFCPLDRKETEKHPLHGCGTRTVPLRGWKWMNNDSVNFLCTAAGGALAVGLAMI